MVRFWWWERELRGSWSQYALKMNRFSYDYSFRFNRLGMQAVSPNPMLEEKRRGERGRERDRERNDKNSEKGKKNPKNSGKT